MTQTCPVCRNSVAADAAVCPNCGFKLAGSTQAFKPVVSEDLATPVINVPPITKSALRVVRGPQIEMVYPLAGKKLVIGRNPQCDIFLNDMTVSRQHAVISPAGESFKIEDTNSFNGVWVNDEVVDSAVLKPGDMVQLGVFCLVYEQE